MTEAFDAVSLEPLHQLRPRGVVVEGAGRAVAVGDRVQGHNRRYARVVRSLGDHQRPTEPPAEQDDRNRAGVVAAAQVIDPGTNVLDLLAGNKPPALTIAEAEAAIVETEAGIAARDQRRAKRAGCRPSDPGSPSRRSRPQNSRGRRVPELAIQPLSVAEKAYGLAITHAGSPADSREGAL